MCAKRWIGEKVWKDKAAQRSANEIKLIFRGVNKDNSHESIVVVQALDSVLGKHIKEIIEIFEKLVGLWVLQNLVSGLEDPHRLGINKVSKQKISLN